MPDHGDHTTLFAGSASGFTPDGMVTVSATMPGGTAYPTTYPKTADGTGAFSWSWQWDTGEPDGVWTITFRDHTSGKTTSTSLTITGNGPTKMVGPKESVSPEVSTGLKVSVSPKSGDHATVFIGTASGFTKNGKVTVSATMPGGTAYPTTYPKTADGTGAFSWSWQWDTGEPDGVWTIKFRDHTSGKSTSTSLTITGSRNSQPFSLRVSVSPKVGDHTTLFVGAASGFTANGKVTVSATMPGGTAYPTTYPKTADGTGAFSWSWQWDTGEPDGVWTIKFRDHTSGKSTSISLTITG